MHKMSSLVQHNTLPKKSAQSIAKENCEILSLEDTSTCLFISHFLHSCHSLVHFTEWFLLQISILSTDCFILWHLLNLINSVCSWVAARKKGERETDKKVAVVHFCGHAKHLTKL